MATILIKNADYLVIGNEKNEVLKKASLLIEDNKIKAINPPVNKADRVIDARGKIILPGLINTHHHLSQAFLRHVDELQNQPIDKWINLMAKLTAKMNPEAYYYSAIANLGELLLSGCTTSADMLYLFPKKYSHQEIFEAEIKAARDLGIRFHLFCGSMSLSQKDGTLFPDEMVETSAEIKARTEMMIEKYHDKRGSAMIKVGIAPCTVFTNSKQDYLNAAKMAKKYDVNLQTHVSESEFEQKYILKKFKVTPLKYLQSLGWDDDRVSWVHGIEFKGADLKLIKQKNQSVCHCPISNCRAPFGQNGIAPVWEMLQEKIKVGIGVDGSAGNDSSNMLEEMRWTRVLQGVRKETTYLKPIEVFKMATINGAKALRWDKAIGSLEVDKCADVAIFNVEDSLDHVGVWNKVGGLISCQAKRADTVIVNGKIVVENGQLLTQNETKLIKKANKVWGKTFHLYDAGSN